MTLEWSPLAWTLLARSSMRLSLVVLCVLAVSVSACDEGNPVGPSVGIDEQFTLAPSDAASVRDVDLAVQFVSVSGDSRCPADAVCIQGGDALVNIRVIERGDRSSSYELHTGDSSRATVTHGQARISLVELQPYPFSSRTIAPNEYRATLRVSR